ncbi:ferredoxin reductase [Cellulosimicrobium arenosum]|uniref:Ferredoxin reductase n=2 Tax=Cellulosimicrobium arenosum TaxID=2708133 RepID=A0A927G8W6_9MICO|nr:ferredoxin reductase [Cellulosimicrobium arenosum]MBD8078480.1 ferredoxin reductase [Cellulosimicrobium arenosum]
MPSGWRVATLVDARAESRTARTLVLDVPDWPGHLAGQHLDLRLTAPDGYTAERSYSIASAASGTAPSVRVEITVQRVPGGEVSGYLTDAFAVGDAIEVRGPVGGWFVWSPVHDAGRPVLLAAGGSGVVPLVSMLRTRRDAGDRTPFRLVYSVRRPEDRLYVDELARRAEDGLEANVAFTRAAPLDARRAPGRLTLAELGAWGWPADIEPACFVCGPTGFVEAVSRTLVALGHDPACVKTERFGPAVD